MNATKKCSLSGIAFTMDPQAYSELNDYLEKLKESYRDSAEGPEIVADIEARIAELILSTQDNTRVVELPLVRNIIGQMGSVTEINTEEPATPHHEAAVRNPRRLYRDPDNAKLGGVCAGLGKYFDVDPVWMRVLIFLPVILACFSGLPIFGHWVSAMMGNLFGCFCISYVVMWFAIPVARTARQKLEMNGERITAYSIGQTTRAANDPDGASKTIVADTVSLFGKVLMVLLKLFAGLIVFGLVMIACGLFIGLIYIAIGGHEIFDPGLHIAVPILGIFIALIPVVMLIYVLMCLLASRKPNGKGIFGMFIVWILTIIACSTIGIRSHVIEQIAHKQHDRLMRTISKENRNVLESEVMINGQEYTVQQLLEEIDNDAFLEELRGSEKATKEVKIAVPSVSLSVKKQQTEKGSSATISIETTTNAAAETAPPADPAAETEHH